MTDSSVLFLFDQITIGAVFFIIQISINIHLADIVEQIEIKMINLTFLKLLLKNLFCLSEISKIVSREFCRQIKLVSGIFLQRISHDDL